MSRGALVDALAVLLLFCLGVALRLPLIPLLDVSSDATDPIVSALRILDSWNPFLTDSPRFGYGRSLSYVPLVLAGQDGLATAALRRAVAQACVAPVTYLAMRMLVSRFELRPSFVLGPLLAGLLLVVNQDLLQNLLWGHHGYFGPEWAAVLLLGFAGLLVGVRVRLWGLVTGLALAMCIMNHPYAITALAVPLVAWHWARRRDEVARSRAALLALGAAALALLPHGLYLLSAPANSVGLDLVESLVPASRLSLAWPLQVVSGLLSDVATGEAALFAAALLALLAAGRFASLMTVPPQLSRVMTPLGLATLATLAGLLVMGLVSRQVHNWHWRMLLPFGCACSGLVLTWLGYQLELGEGGGRSATRRPLLLSVAALTLMLAGMTWVFRDGVHAYTHPAEQPRESLLQLSQVERVYGLLEADADAGPWTVLAHGLPPEQSHARTLPLALQRVLSPGSEVVFAASPGAWLQGATLIYFEGPGPWIDAVAAGSAAAPASTLWRGTASLALRTESHTAALRVGAALCAASAGAPFSDASPRDGLALLAEMGLADGFVAGAKLPAGNPCGRRP
jgi:hypothetical protein